MLKIFIVLFLKKDLINHDSKNDILYICILMEITEYRLEQRQKIGLWYTDFYPARFFKYSLNKIFSSSFKVDIPAFALI